MVHVFCNLNGQPELWDNIVDATAQDIISIVSRFPRRKLPLLSFCLSSDVLSLHL